MITLSEENLTDYLRLIFPRIKEWQGFKLIGAEEITEQTYVNFIFKATLKKGQVKKDYYLRQSRDYVKKSPDKKVDPDRIRFEVKILKLLNKITKDLVPEVVYFDKENKVAVLSDMKRGAPLLVNELVAGRAHPEAGKYFGEMIAKIHRTTFGIDNRKVRGGQVANKAAVNFHLGMRLEPGLKMAPEATRKLLDDGKKEPNCLVLGDLASKNIFPDGQKVRFVDLERVFVGDPAFDPAFLFCHCLIEIPPEKIDQSLKFINNFMIGYRRTMREKLSDLEMKKLENRIIRFLGITILYRLFGFYLVIDVGESKEKWKIIAKRLLKDSRSTSITEALNKVL